MDTDLVNSGSNGLHWFPVIRHQALLHTAELVTRVPSCLFGKSSKVIERRSQPADHLVDHNSIYTYLYITGKCNRAFTANTQTPFRPRMVKIFSRAASDCNGVSCPIRSNNSADGQRLEGVLVLGWNPPDSRSNLFASGSMSARRSWLPIGRPAEGDAGECLDQTRAAGAQSQIVMEVGKGIRPRGGSSTAACRPVAHGTRSCRLCKAIRRPVRCRVL